MYININIGLEWSQGTKKPSTSLNEFNSDFLFLTIPKLKMQPLIISKK